MYTAAVIAAVTSAAISLAANMLLGRTGRSGIVLYTPIFEETAKTAVALVFGASIPITHILFGILESLGDYVWGGKQKILAAACSVAAHTIFGLLTIFVLNSGYPYVTAILSAIAVHVLWNNIVLKVSG